MSGLVFCVLIHIGYECALLWMVLESSNSIESVWGLADQTSIEQAVMLKSARAIWPRLKPNLTKHLSQSEFAETVPIPKFGQVKRQKILPQISEVLIEDLLRQTRGIRRRSAKRSRYDDRFPSEVIATSKLLDQPNSPVSSPLSSSMFSGV